MRVAARLLASVKPSQFLEPGAPTGLCGLLTHPSPRSALLYHYHSTLDKLKQIPESSVYRQSTEALTKHRLQIIEQSKPQGWDEWQAAIQKKVGADVEAYKIVNTSAGQTVVVTDQSEADFRTHEAAWDGEAKIAMPEGIRSPKERANLARRLKGSKDYKPERVLKDMKIDPEPQFTAEVISELESKFGAGLLEEVIVVAEGEHRLVQTMIDSKVWETLEEKTPEGQWAYFERNTHTGTT